MRYINSKYGKNAQSQSVDSNTAMATNLKLISALENEERRLRENELKYVERIKALSADLAVSKEKQVQMRDLESQILSMVFL